MVRLDSRPGTYTLVLHAEAAEHVEVGKRGRLEVTPGFYVYVGSALGPGGLSARISRHWATAKRLRWHVDYVREVTTPTEVWYTYDVLRRECAWADVFRQMPGASLPLTGLGSSDCTCPSHLFFFGEKPSRAAFIRRLRRVVVGHGPVHCETMAPRGGDQARCCVVSPAVCD